MDPCKSKAWQNLKVPMLGPTSNRKKNRKRREQKALLEIYNSQLKKLKCANTSINTRNAPSLKVSDESLKTQRWTSRRTHSNGVATMQTCENQSWKRSEIIVHKRANLDILWHVTSFQNMFDKHYIQTEKARMKFLCSLKNIRRIERINNVENARKPRMKRCEMQRCEMQRWNDVTPHDEKTWKPTWYDMNSNDENWRWNYY